MRDSIAQYRRLFETAQDGFLIVNAETGLIVDVNPSLSDLLKYPRSRFIGEKIWELGFFNHIVASRENFVKLQQQEHTRFERVPLESAAGRRMEVDLVSNVYLVDAQRAMHWHIRDVTERSQAEARINLQLSALNATANAIAITDRECSIEWVNPAFSALTGYRASEVIGTSIGVLKSRAQPLEFYVDLWAALQAGKVWREEVESKRKDGQCYMEEVTITPVPGPDGQPARFVVVKQNITERKRAAERIQRLNRTYEVLSEINTIIVREKDPMKMLNTACGIAVDKGLFRMAWVGFPDAQSTRMNVVAQAGDTQDYLENLRMTLLDEPRGRGPSAQALRSGRHVICNNIEQDSRMAPWREAAQRMGFRSLAALPLTVESRPVGVLTLYSGFTEFFDPEEMRLLDELAADMSFALEVSQRETERGKSEEELRWRTAFFEALVESAQDGILVVDVHGNRILQNDRMVSLWKIPRHLAEDRDISAQFAFARGTTKNPEQFEDKVAFLYAHPDEISQDEVELIDGTILEQYSSPVRYKAGRYYGRIWVFRDITERKRLNQQLLRAQRMESIGTLAGGIAHDLNNVLGPIILSLDLLKMKFPDPDSEELLSIIGGSARRGASMVSQVLSFARGVEGRRVELQIKHVIREIKKIADDTFLKHVQIHTIYSPDLWTVVADPTQLHQVLLNLCVNARDAMPDGGKLTLTAENLVIDAHYAHMSGEVTPGPYLLLQVEDTGTGIPPEIIEKIFDPFFTTKEIGKGTGLGLSMTLSIVKSHGGFVRVYSELGSGTKFKIYLPAQTGAFLETDLPAPVELPRGNGELILVVDDEASVRLVTAQTLQAFGYDVLLAAGGVEAVALFAQRGEEIGAVLTDIMMPILDGPATIRVLRQMNRRVPIIATSGLTANRQIAQYANLDVKHFLSKPYTAEALLKTLREALAEAASPPTAETDSRLVA